MVCKKKMLPLWRCIPVLVLVLLISSIPLIGQESKKEDYRANNMSFGLSAGSQAFIGADLTYPLSRHFDIRAGFNYMKFIGSGFEINASNLGFSDQILLVDADINFSTISLLLGYSPGRKGTFRLMAGALYGLNNYLTTTIYFRDNFQLNDYELTPDRVGQITGHYYTNSSLYPYVGLGLGRSIPKRRISLSLELGGYFRGAPQIDISSTGLLEDNEQNGPVLEKNLSALKWHPSISGRLAYRFRFKKSEREAYEPAESLNFYESPSKTVNIENSVESSTKIVGNNANSSPFLAFEGLAISHDGQTPMDYVQLYLYLLKPDGERELARTQRYNGGQFKVWLQKGERYEIQLEHHLYKLFVKDIEIRKDCKDASIAETFTLSLK